MQKNKKLFSEGKIVSSMYVFFLQSAKEFLKQGSVTAEVFFRTNEKGKRHDIQMTLQKISLMIFLMAEFMP